MLTANENDISIWEVVNNASNYPILGSAVKHIKNFAIMMQSFMSMQEKSDAYELASHVAKQANLLGTLFKDKTIEGVSKYENLVELLNGIKEFVEDDESEEEKSLAS